MKKSLLALAALTAFAGVASAQSSVTLFGIVDVNARYTKNGTNVIKSLSTDGNSSSRLGFRGVEDLGGGMSAGFWIEGALSPDNGNAAGQTWQRRSTVSLMGGFGEIRLGRDYTPTFWNHTVFDPFGTNGVGSQTNLMAPIGSTNVLGGGATTLVRTNNSIGYFLPAMGGLYGQVQVSAAEGAPNGNKYMGARFGYAAGPVNVAVAMGKTDILTTRDMKAINLGASYNAGFMTVFGQYHRYSLNNNPGTDPKQTNMMLGVAVPVGAGTIKASYGKVSADGTAFDGSQVALGYVYDLSKRSALYTHFSRISNGAGASFAVSSTAPFGGTNAKPTSTGFEFGVRHSF